MGLSVQSACPALVLGGEQSWRGRESSSPGRRGPRGPALAHTGAQTRVHQLNSRSFLFISFLPELFSLCSCSLSLLTLSLLQLLPSSFTSSGFFRPQLSLLALSSLPPSDLYAPSHGCLSPHSSPPAPPQSVTHKHTHFIIYTIFPLRLLYA